MNAVSEILRWGHYCAERGLIRGKSGNASVRWSADRFLITATGSRMGQLGPEDVVVCNLQEGVPHSGRRPSMESDMHRLLLRKLPKAQAALHTSPLYSTLFACTQESIDLTLTPETMIYLNRIVRIPYFHPGSRELAQNVAERLELGDIGVLENHGLMVPATSLEEAVFLTETFESHCQMLYMARCADLSLNFMPSTVQNELRVHLGLTSQSGLRNGTSATGSSVPPGSELPRPIAQGN